MNNDYSITNQPCSLQTEMAILGTMLTDEKALENCLSLLTIDDFYEFKNKYILEAITACIKKDRSVEIHTVYEELVSSSLKPIFDTPVYLLDCVQSSHIGMDIESYVEILKEKRAHRELLKTGLEIVGQTIKPVKDVAESLETFGRRIFAIARPKLDLDNIPTQIASITEIKELYDLSYEYESTGKIARRGLQTGYEDLDNIIDGLKGGNLVVLAARTGVGKTAFAINLAHNIAIKNKNPTLFLSLEMTQKELIRRLLCIDSGVSSSRMAKGTISQMDKSKLNDTIKNFDDCKLYLYDKAGLTMSDIRAKTRRMVESNGIKLLIVDYLQLISSTRHSDNRQTEVAEISRALKVLAKDLDIPIICLAQLSRKTEERESKIPILSDLRESGAIEQDSDAVIFLSRPDMYDRMRKPGVMEVIVAKNRHGQTGSIDLRFDGETSRVSAICYNAVPNYNDRD